MGRLKMREGFLDTPGDFVVRLALSFELNRRLKIAQGYVHLFRGHHTSRMMKTSIKATDERR